jgi:hypothetical protein
MLQFHTKAYKLKKGKSSFTDVQLPLLQAVVSHQCVKEEVTVYDVSPVHLVKDSFKSITRTRRVIDAKVGALLLRSSGMNEANTCVPTASVLVAELYTCLVRLRFYKRDETYQIISTVLLRHSVCIFDYPSSPSSFARSRDCTKELRISQLYEGFAWSSDGG